MVVRWELEDGWERVGVRSELVFFCFRCSVFSHSKSSCFTKGGTSSVVSTFMSKRPLHVAATAMHRKYLACLALLVAGPLIDIVPEGRLKVTQRASSWARTFKYTSCVFSRSLLDVSLLPMLHAFAILVTCLLSRFI